jgi:putative intracellular protease/amidase
MVNPNFQQITFSVIGPEKTLISTGPAEGDPSPLKSRVAQTIMPTHTFDAPPNDVDVLIVPGGFGAGPKALFGGGWEPPTTERVVQFLREQYPKVKHLLSKSVQVPLQARSG